MGLISRVSSRTYRTPFVTMVFNKYVEVGRICYVPDLGKIACIVDVADMRHVLVDGNSINRQKINLNRIQLTKFMATGLLHGARTKNVLKAFKDHTSTVNGLVQHGHKSSLKRNSELDSTTFNDSSS